MFTTTLAAAIFYVLSYPPYLAIRYEKPGPVAIGVMGAHYDLDDEYFAKINHPFYAPIEWLVDHTVLEKPISAWAMICGSNDKVQRDSLYRSIDRMPNLLEFKPGVLKRRP
jgi:hypothetical protein